MTNLHVFNPETAANLFPSLPIHSLSFCLCRISHCLAGSLGPPSPWLALWGQSSTMLGTKYYNGSRGVSSGPLGGQLGTHNVLLITCHCAARSPHSVSLTTHSPAFCLWYISLLILCQSNSKFNENFVMLLLIRQGSHKNLRKSSMIFQWLL